MTNLQNEVDPWSSFRQAEGARSMRADQMIKRVRLPLLGALYSQNNALLEPLFALASNSKSSNYEEGRPRTFSLNPLEIDLRDWGIPSFTSQVGHLVFDQDRDEGLQIDAQLHLSLDEYDPYTADSVAIQSHASGELSIIPSFEGRGSPIDTWKVPELHTAVKLGETITQAIVGSSNWQITQVSRYPLQPVESQSLKTLYKPL